MFNNRLKIYDKNKKKYSHIIEFNPKKNPELFEKIYKNELTNSTIWKYKKTNLLFKKYKNRDIKLISNEIKRNIKIKKIVMDTKNLHFPIFYGYNDGYFIIEYFEKIDIHNFIVNLIKNMNNLCWEIFFFQLMYINYIFSKYNFKHSDLLNYRNLFITKIDNINNKYLIYNINNKIYKIPNLGFLIICIDFDNIDRKYGDIDFYYTITCFPQIYEASIIYSKNNFDKIQYNYKNFIKHLQKKGKIIDKIDIIYFLVLYNKINYNINNEVLKIYNIIKKDTNFNFKYFDKYII